MYISAVKQQCLVSAIVMSFPCKDAQTHGDDKVLQKKVSKLPILILILLSQKLFYVYQPKHNFLQIHNDWGKISPSKTTTGDSSRFASSPRTKITLPKVYNITYSS
jgi:hypothetical protein